MIANNNNNGTQQQQQQTTNLDDSMPQWKRDLIMMRRRRHQQQQNGNNHQQTVDSAFSTINGVGGSSGRIVVVSSSATASSVRASAYSSVTLGCTGGHQPIITTTRNDDDAESSSACCALAVGSSHSGLSGAAASSSCTCCNECHSNMVQVHNNEFDSTEDLQYGPGIVNKLKNHYLNLTLREASFKTRPTILRKATSLENLLDGDAADNGQQRQMLERQRLYESRTNGSYQYNNNGVRNVVSSVPNRFHRRNAGATFLSRGHEVMKRARSVEAISTQPLEAETNSSSHSSDACLRPKSVELRPKSLEGLRPKSEDFTTNPIVTPRINRPKRLTPIITEREKPPVDVVRQTKKLFEARPEQRTPKPHTTGDVATKVANFKTIINSNKPPIKHKPNTLLICSDKSSSGNKKRLSPLKAPTSPPPEIPKSNNHQPISPIPDVSMVDHRHLLALDDSNEHIGNNRGSLSLETPDLILHSSPTHHQHQQKVEIEEFLIAEINHSKEIIERKALQNNTSDNYHHQQLEDNYQQQRDGNLYRNEDNLHGKEDSLHGKEDNLHGKEDNLHRQDDHLHSQGNHLYRQEDHFHRFEDDLQRREGNGYKHEDSLCSKYDDHYHEDHKTAERIIDNHGVGFSETISPIVNFQPLLSPREIEKNFINTNKSSVVINKYLADDNATSPINAKKKCKQLQQQQQQNSIIFKFTDRKEVPDYVQNDGTIRNGGKIELPRAGESGITILPGLSIESVFGNINDDDEELLSLEGPPSPCNVIFINDNVLIDGKSSLSQKSTKRRTNVHSNNQTMRIKFVEAVPQIFEYPSEASMLQVQVDHLVDHSAKLAQSNPIAAHNAHNPILGGSNLANYTPKSNLNEFQLGVTKTANIQVPTIASINTDSDQFNREQDKGEDEAIVFSAGSNADILF